MANLIPVSEVQTMALAVAKSGLFGMKTPEQALALMLVAQSEGLHPARAAMEYHVIQGRPALKADAMLARFQAAGGKVEWKAYTDEKVVGVFSHPNGGSIEVDWSIDRAKQAGVYGKNPTWKSYPRAMLRARCISEGIRSIYPGVSVGVYTPEEVADFAEEKDVTPAPEAKPTPAPEAVKAKAAQMKADSAKAAKQGKPVATVIEGTAKVVTDADPGLPPEAGDLSDIGAPQKPTQEQLGKVVNAFAGIGYTIEQLEEEYGKRIDEWTMDDMTEARQVYTLKKAERAQMIADIAASKKVASVSDEDVVV